MLGQFTFYNPTRLHFGKEALQALAGELAAVGPVVQLIYGKGSVKRTGLYDQVVEILKTAGKTIVEDAGVMPNPTYDKVKEGCAIARDNHVDFLLAVGGGSVCDYAKAVAAGAYCPEDPWEKYYVRDELVDHRVLPIGCILTVVGTGSEMNGGSVITNHDVDLKVGHVFEAALYPKFAILNPEWTYTLPTYQMVAGFYDIMCHILEQYLSGSDDSTSDYLAEGLMRSLVQSSRIAVKEPTNYEARSNIMWTATWALNTLIAQGKSTDWMVHMIGHAVGTFTNATHGMTLAAVSMAYYNAILQAGLPRFKRFAIAVWGVDPTGKTDEAIAREGLEALRQWMISIGLVMNLRDLGVTPEMIPAITNATFILDGGYKTLTPEEITAILHASL
jgi:alcohol dehydrogenase YqhD (iron-dependent ADH family)